MIHTVPHQVVRKTPSQTSLQESCTQIESAALTVEEIAEAAAVPVIDELRGRAVEMYVSLKPGLTPGKEIEAKVVTAVETEMGVALLQ